MHPIQTVISSNSNDYACRINYSVSFSVQHWIFQAHFNIHIVKKTQLHEKKMCGHKKSCSVNVQMSVG